MRRLIFVFVFTFLLFLSACSSSQQDDENVNPFFNAEVISWGTDDVMLSPVDIPDEEIDDQFAVLGEFAIPVRTFENSGIAELNCGDMVRVVTSGLVEDDTAGSPYIRTVFRLYPLDSDGNAIHDNE